MDTTTREERTELERQCAELAALLDGGWTRGQKDRCSLFHEAAMSDSVPVMRAALARWNAYNADTRRAYLATARRARERRDLARQPGASNHTLSAEPIPFPQRPARTMRYYLTNSPLYFGTPDHPQRPIRRQIVDLAARRAAKGIIE